MNAYYNDNDPFVAEWLRALIRKGLIADGEVDERSIAGVRADELRGFAQCHFFAGLGGWSHALRLARWPDDRPVWTGSCPCQPFSAAGQGKAADDERHLWPSWFSLIRECRPPIVFGEQVEAAIGWGWLDAIFADLETESYACGAAVLPACSVGAPHIRQRLWFVGVASRRDVRWDGRTGTGAQAQGLSEWDEVGCLRDHSRTSSAVVGQADNCGSGLEVWREHPAWGECAAAERGGEAGELEQSNGIGRKWRKAPASRDDNHGSASRWAQGQHGPSVDGSHWADLEWLPCTDGKARPVKPGIQPLAHGIPARMAKLRAIGNAIVPQVAAEFIRATDGGRP